MLLDKARFPRDKPCAEYLSPGVLAALRQLGIAHVIAGRQRFPLWGFRLCDGRTQVRARFAPAACGVAAPRLEFDAALIRAAGDAGVMVEEGVRVVGVQDEATAVVVTALAAGGRRLTLRARYVLGCDGINSTVAHRLGIRQSDRSLRRIGLVTHVSGIEHLDHFGEMHIGDGYYCGLAPFDAQTANVAMVVAQADVQAARARPEALLLDRLRRLPSLAPRLQYLRFEKPLTVVGPLAVAARPASGSGILLSGDAAGFYDPLTGQGIYRALRGAELATRTIVEAMHTGNRSGAVRKLAHRRRRAFAGGWVVERVVQAVVSRPRLRERVFANLQRRPDLADRLISVTGDHLPASAVLNPAYLARLFA
jgi:flavin-dependent dehydrogenase